MLTSFYYTQYPDHFVSDAQKRTPKYIKQTVDYFATIAFQQYNENDEIFSKNYKLLKGIIDKADFWEEDQGREVHSLIDTLTRDLSLPGYVKHYSILNPPINALLGELSARPDNIRIRAYDDDSKTEEGLAKTAFLQSYLQAKVSSRISAQLQAAGYQADSDEYNEQLAGLSNEQLQEYMTSYTSMAEKWANHVLSALKIAFDLKEKSEDAFRDLLVTSRQFYHIREDKSRIGFNVEVVNPKNAWYLTTPDQKYTKQAYACGTIKVMELSDILEQYPLTKEEIDYLQDQARGYYLEGMGARKSNLFNNSTGDSSVTYDVYDPLVARYKLLEESKILAEQQLNTFLGLTPAGYTTYGNKFVVVQCYWRSKKKIGKLTYLDQQGMEQTLLVDETYRKVPTEISIEWTWVNQWWKATKIGPHVYVDIAPLQVLDYSPIIGVIHEAKNSPAKSLLDLMKPFQTLYDVCMNQLFLLLKKDKGVVFVTSLRHIPRPKDGDYTDAIDQWEMEAMERGIIFVDDSPENLKGGGTFAQTGRHDLSRHNEIQARYNLAVALKNECWELVGFSRERLGSIAASQTATGTQAALSRSFTQTEPYFVAHEYVLTQLHQAIVDAAQYIESQKPSSTISYITNEGENAFIQVTSSDIKLRDFHVYASGGAEDRRLFDELRQLAQPLLQNGATAYEIAMLYSTNSIRQMKDVFRRIKEKQEAFQQQQMDLQQQEQAMAAQQFQDNMEHEDLVRQEQMINDNYQKELDRINKKEIALIQANSHADTNVSSTALDFTATAQLSLDAVAVEHQRQQGLQQLQLERQKLEKERDIELRKLSLEKEKLKLEEKKMKNDLKIARYRDKGKLSSKKK